MRASAALVIGLLGCGRIGYDAVGDDVPPLDAPMIDTPDVRGLATCNTPLEVMTLPVPAGGQIRALDLAGTATGFVAAWSLDDAVWATGLSVVDAGGGVPRLASVQDGEEVVDFGSPDLAIEALGDEVVLVIDDAAGDLLSFHPLDGHGQWRTSPKEEMGVHIHGGDFLVPDPDVQRFGVVASDGIDAYAAEIDVDTHIQGNPMVAVAGIVPDTAGIAKLGDGYAVITGRDAQCDIIAVDDNLAPLGAVQTVSMTCHNAQIVNPTGDHVVAAWNCDNDRVWLTGGSMSSALPAHHELYGDATNVASNPRLAATSAGVWYGFQVSGGRLGRALVDLNGNDPPLVAADIVVASGADTLDLAVHGGLAFLFWTSGTSLWTMQLCAP